MILVQPLRGGVIIKVSNQHNIPYPEQRLSERPTTDRISSIHHKPWNMGG